MKNKQVEWYTLNEIDKFEAQYYIIFGQRSNGKSYSVDMRVIDNFFTKGAEFIIIKRFEEDVKTKICSTMLTPLYDYILDTYGYKVKFYQGKWLCYEDGKSEKLSDCLTMGYALSVSSSDRIKGGQFPKVTTVIFEEFMSMKAIYLPDEINLFINLISTVGRNRTNLKVYMLANAISKYSPYSSALKVKLHRLKHGEIVAREYKDKKGFKTKFIIQRCANVNVFDNAENEKKVVYNIFGDAGVGNMITTGDFETHAYNKAVKNVTFPENLKYLKGKYDCFTKEHRLPIILCYEDYVFRLYKYKGENIIYGFREVDIKTVSDKNTSIMINSNIHINGVININNLARFSTKSEIINQELNDIVHALYQDNNVFLNAENSEDVKNAFRMSGISL